MTERSVPGRLSADISRATFLRLTALGAAGLVVPGLAACETKKSPSSTGKPGLPARPTIRLGSEMDWGNPSPFAYISGPGYWRMLRIFDTLIWKDETGSFIPWLASSWESPDQGTTWLFTLRPDVKWQDGKPLTARDVAFSFTYPATRPPSPTANIGTPRAIKGARALSDTKVEITLEAPLVTFLRTQAGGVPILPEHVWSKVADPAKFTGADSVMGSGPYRLATHRPDGSYDFQANDAFFLGKPFVRRVQEIPAGNPFLALQKGDIDGAMTPPGAPVKAVLDQLRKNPQLQVLDGPADFMNVLFFNSSKGPLADRSVRQAIAYGVNRQGLVQRALQGLGVPGNPGFFPPSNEFSTKVEQYPYNPQKARDLLDRAGYRVLGGVRTGPAGPLRFEILTDGNSARLAELIGADLNQIGVNARPKVLEGAALDAKDASGDYQMEITGFGGLSGDPEFLRFIFAPPGGGGGVPGFQDREFMGLLMRQSIIQDPAQRRQATDRLQQILAEQLPVLPLFYLPLSFAFRKAAFDQWYFTPGGFAGGIPTVFNKQVFVTGRREGTQIRTSRG